MDFASSLKSEVFRPVAVLIVPGAIASFPFFMLATKHFPDLASYRDNHEVPYYAISLLLVIAVGLLLEDVGALIERYRWDKWLDDEYEVSAVWERYLAQTFTTEPIGQRYLRTIVLRMKFELGCSVAFVPFLIGFAWLNIAFPQISWCAYTVLAFTITATVIYLLWASYRSARVLARTRRLILGMRPTTDKRRPS